MYLIAGDRGVLVANTGGEETGVIEDEDGIDDAMLDDRTRALLLARAPRIVADRKLRCRAG
ncbi:MAG: hypothetical protein WD063_20265 [Pirellulales bacterium]